MVDIIPSRPLFFFKRLVSTGFWSWLLNTIRFILILASSLIYYFLDSIAEKRFSSSTCIFFMSPQLLIYPKHPFLYKPSIILGIMCKLLLSIVLILIEIIYAQPFPRRAPTLVSMV